MFNHDICQYLFFREPRILVYLFLMLKFFFYLLFDLLLHLFLVVNSSLGFSICVIDGVIGARGPDACCRSLFHPFWGVILKASSLMQIIFLVCISGYHDWDLWQVLDCAFMWILALRRWISLRGNLMNCHFEWFSALWLVLHVHIDTALLAFLQLMRLPFIFREMLWLFFILIRELMSRWEIKLCIYPCWWKCNLFQTASACRIVSRVAAAALITAQAFPWLHYFTRRKRSIC